MNPVNNAPIFLAHRKPLVAAVRTNDQGVKIADHSKTVTHYDFPDGDSAAVAQRSDWRGSIQVCLYPNDEGRVALVINGQEGVLNVLDDRMVIYRLDNLDALRDLRDAINTLLRAVES